MPERLNGIHLSVHIEKTAGTSVYNYLLKMYGRQNVLVYSPDTDSVFGSDNVVMRLRFSRRMDKLRMSRFFAQTAPIVHAVAMVVLRFGKSGGIKEFSSKNWLAIHGHFQADRFDDVISNPYRTVVLRNPLDRAISHYKYWRKARGVLNQRMVVPFDDKMVFRDFALSSQMLNFQTRSLGTVPIEKFNVVGVTENLQSFISNIAGRRDKSALTFSDHLHLNESPERLGAPELGIDKNFIRRFELLNGQDYDNWHTALKLNDLAAS